MTTKRTFGLMMGSSLAVMASAFIATAAQAQQAAKASAAAAVSPSGMPLYFGGGGSVENLSGCLSSNSDAGGSAEGILS